MSGAARTFGDDLSNRFSKLEVEDIDEKLDLTTLDVNQAAYKAPQAKSKVEYEEVYELVDEFDVDLPFTTYCFFEDLHCIQDFLKEMWTKLTKEELDLMTCAMTTRNIALDMVRRAEEDVISQAPTLLQKPRSYEAIAEVVFFVESSAKGKNPQEAFASDDSLKITPVDEFVYLSTARILMKFEQILAMKVAYPQPVPSVRFSYISRPELLELPQVKKWEEEDELLTQLLMELSLNDNIQKALEALSEQKAPMANEITLGLYVLRREGEISIWIVFAARILLDISDVLGKEISRAHLEQKVAGDKVFALLDFKAEGAKPNPRGERWRTKDGPPVMAFWKLLQYWTVIDPFPMMKQKWLAEKASVVDQYRFFDELPAEIWEQVERKAQATVAEPRPPQHLVANIRKISLHPIKARCRARFPVYSQPHSQWYLDVQRCSGNGTRGYNFSEPPPLDLRYRPSV